jgi:YD repeat-containing protein
LDAANRLVSADVDGVVSSFDYDGLGHPVSACATRDELPHVADGGWRNNSMGGFAPEYVLDTSAWLSAGVAGGLLANEAVYIVEGDGAGYPAALQVQVAETQAAYSRMLRRFWIRSSTQYPS